MNLANHKIYHVLTERMMLKELYGAKLLFQPHELIFFIDLWQPLDLQMLPIKNQMVTDAKKNPLAWY